jgi:hypothetical protein
LTAKNIFLKPIVRLILNLRNLLHQQQNQKKTEEKAAPEEVKYGDTSTKRSQPRTTPTSDAQVGQVVYFKDKQ